MFIYGTILLILIAGLTTSMATRTPIILDVISDRNALYRELPDDIIENAYTLKVINQNNRARTFAISVAGVEGISLDGISDTVTVDAGSVLSVPVRARAHRDNAYGIMTIQFTVKATDDEDAAVIENSRFLGPTP
jgi:polyferredoxin